MNTNKAVVHTSACGVEPYDRSFGVGAKKKFDSGGFSPYPRVEKIRELYKTAPLTLDSGRALVFTEVYKQNESKPFVTRKALAMAKYMETCPLHYEEGELLLVDDGSANCASPLYPEYATWIYDELRNKPLYERNYKPVSYDEKTKEEVLSTESYWRGKSIRDGFKGRLPQECVKGCVATGGILLMHTGVMTDFGVGHYTADFDYALKKGLGGIKDDIRKAIEKIGVPTTLDGLRAIEFHEAQLIVLEGFSTLFKRYAKFAREKVDEYEDSQTKEDLLNMSENCARLAEDAPKTFWEAVQLSSAILMVQFMESSGNGISLGRADQYWYPYYKYSLDNGIHTKDFMQELIEHYYLKQMTHEPIRENTGNDMWRGGTKGWTGSALIVGGVDAEGNDATNDLSFMLLDAMTHTRLINPYLAVRWHEGTPYELKVKVAETIRLGMGHPKILSDKVCMDALMRQGVSLEDARDYVNIGCVELEVPGKTMGWHDNASFSLPKVLELALNNGRCIACAGERCRNYHTCCRGIGKSVGLETGYLKDFKTFDEVVAAYEAQLKYWTDRMYVTLELLQSIHLERDDLPFTSTLISDCITNGKSVMHGGARYNYTGIQCLGPATVADSLTALKQVVYEEKKYTAEEFYDALTKNWEGYERLYQLVNGDKVHHYGNDDDYADDMMKYVVDTYANQMQSYPPTRGGIGVIKTGAFSTTINLMFGMGVGATPDGRKHAEAISENIGAARTAHSNRDRNGPTAYARSIGKLDHAKFGSGTLINMKFGNDTISGEKGRDDFIGFLDGYFEANPLHIQFMVANRDTLIEAQKNPKDYQDLLVRVSGFSSYFHTLSKGFQDELINRTEHTLD